MARKKITADLNGGDAITAMGDLLFQVHDASDDSIISTANYAAIGSYNTQGTDSANITYTLNTTGGSGNNGQIVLDGVDIGSATSVKIRCKDEDGNESILSDSFVAVYYKINMTAANSEQIVIPFDWSGNFDIEITMESWSGSSTLYLMGNSESTNNNTETGVAILAAFASKPELKTTNPAGTGVTTIASALAVTSLLRVTKVSDVISYYTDGNLNGTTTNTNYVAATGGELFIGSFGNALYATSAVSKVVFDGKTLQFTEGSGSTQDTTDSTVTATLESTGTINDMWVAL